MCQIKEINRYNKMLYQLMLYNNIVIFLKMFTIFNIVLKTIQWNFISLLSLKDCGYEAG